MAAAAAVMDVIEDEKLQLHAAEVGAMLRTELRSWPRPTSGSATSGVPAYTREWRWSTTPPPALPIAPERCTS